ncbi:DUF2785 domain-containing protein [Vagococcus teuberi]|uniref:DUF2785 domain-containing protein n=1 Tax=Vagococcus teuberi TaxID=519472 RepID=A0A1J0A7Y7_9ENTE|nr:DUF2785 domain-containing protein [Vagococcus teuberi]APB32056.1 hypothetical protein BHY08_09685 [Vagococcus teuberi]
MKEKLLTKIQSENDVYADEEIYWLMDNIGNTDASIRDDIVFNTLANGIVEGMFTDKQFIHIKDKTIEEHLIFYRIEEQLPSTLTRSFTALLNGFIIQSDGDLKSPYHNLLTHDEREYFFNTAIIYLQKEIDKTGYSEIYGWVHAFAHGGDYLSKVVQHYLFEECLSKEVLETVSYVLDNIEKPFLDEEEKRIAHAIFVGIKHHKISDELMISWIHQFNFPLEINADFYRLATFKNILAYIYFHCLTEECLTKNLEQVLLGYLKEY